TLVTTAVPPAAPARVARGAATVSKRAIRSTATSAPAKAAIPSEGAIRRAAARARVARRAAIPIPAACRAVVPTRAVRRAVVLTRAASRPETFIREAAPTQGVPLREGRKAFL